MKTESTSRRLTTTALIRPASRRRTAAAALRRALPAVRVAATAVAALLTIGVLEALVGRAWLIALALAAAMLARYVVSPVEPGERTRDRAA